MKNTFQIDAAHSGAHFSVRHLMISNVRGTLGNVTGTVVWDADNLAASSIDATIDLTTLNTNDEKRDTHVKGADFLNVEQFPKISFQSKKFERESADELKVTGDLTIHGVTKEVVLAVEGPTAEGSDPWGKTRMGASARGKILRSDFGVSWNAALEAGGVVIGDEMKVELEIEMVKA